MLQGAPSGGWHWSAPLGNDRVGTVRVGTIRVGTVRVGTIRVGTVRLGTITVGTVRVLNIINFTNCRPKMAAFSLKTFRLFNSTMVCIFYCKVSFFSEKYFS